MTISNRAAAEAWLRDQLKDADPFFVDEALSYIRRTPPRGGAGEARASGGAIAPPLMRFDDINGKAVFLDPRYVTGVRDAQSTKIVSSIITVTPPNRQGTSQIYIVVGRSENVGDRINMHRRGYGERLDAAVADMKQRGLFEETDYTITSGKLVIPDAMEFTEEKFFSDVPDADIIQAAYDAAQAVAAEKPDLDISLAEDELS